MDFYCPKAKLVIELDGGQHYKPDYQIKDQTRDDQLAALGLRVLRFNNRQVLKEMDAVMEVIRREIDAVVGKKGNPLRPPFFKDDLYTHLTPRLSFGVGGEGDKLLILLT